MGWLRWNRIQGRCNHWVRSLIGTTRRIADTIERYEKTGLNYFEFKFIYPTTKDFYRMMEAFAADVIPSFR